MLSYIILYRSELLSFLFVFSLVALCRINVSATDQSAIAVLHGVWAAYGYSFAANHDHENYMHTIGMGEVEVVLNGVNFRTRHND